MMRTDTVFHIYDEKGVVAHSLTVDEMEEKIITKTEDDVSADRLKNAAATKKLAIFDAFEILNRIQEEENMLEGKTPKEAKKEVFRGFAEGRSK